jgi:steroid delta-isomerase-like uncharacterized protein
MTIDQNKAVVRRVYDLVNAGDVAGFDDIIADDIVIHTPIPGVEPGLESWRNFVGLFLGAFPENHTDVDQLTAEGDRVVARHTHHGVHGGEFMGIPPTGKSVSIVGIEEFRVADGKVVEFWHQDDLLSLLMQLGAVPMP